MPVTFVRDGDRGVGGVVPGDREGREEGTWLGVSHHLLHTPAHTGSLPGKQLCLKTKGTVAALSGEWLQNAIFGPSPHWEPGKSIHHCFSITYF